jgi:hypothetical protein
MLKKVFLAGSVALMLGSCMVSQTYQLTNEPVGTKVGVAKMKIFGKEKDFTIKTASKNGGITTIGAVEITMKYVLIFPQYKTTVFGE